MSEVSEYPLLHSLTVFWNQIRRSLEIVRPQRIVEIGNESGALTERLTVWAQESQAQVVSVDPMPAASTRALAQGSGHLLLVEAKSPWALESVGHAEVYVIDGDHNYWTVSRELEHLFGAEAADPALAILHDVAWPCARRDQYYDPSGLPPEATHEYSFRGGVLPTDQGVSDGGFRGAGAYAYAKREGGERNGVLTAVEDAMRRRQDLELIRLPCVFGVGFLFPGSADWADELRQSLAPLHELSLLDTLERDRVALYLRLVALQDEFERERLRVDRVISQLTHTVDSLTAENLARHPDVTQRSIEAS